MLDIDDLSTATQIDTDIVKHRAMTSATNVKVIGVLGLTAVGGGRRRSKVCSVSELSHSFRE